MTNYFKTLINAVSVVVVLALSALAQRADFGSKHWTLTYLNGKAVGESKAYMEIDPSAGRFNGNAGCNRMFGSVKVNDRNLTFSGVGMTRMACADSNVMKLEGDFAKALEQATRYRISGSELSIYAGDKRIIRLNARAGSDEGTASNIKLEDKKWVLRSIGNTAAGELGKLAFINFDAAKGGAGGSTSCNGFGGNYTVKGNSLTFTHTVSTMRACIEDDRMDIERSFLGGLQNTDRYEIRDGVLRLYKGNELLLTLRAESK